MKFSNGPFLLVWQFFLLHSSSVGILFLSPLKLHGWVHPMVYHLNSFHTHSVAFHTVILLLEKKVKIGSWKCLFLSQQVKMFVSGIKHFFHPLGLMIIVNLKYLYRTVVSQKRGWYYQSDPWIQRIALTSFWTFAAISGYVCWETKQMVLHYE